jgi:hypothetical protein
VTLALGAELAFVALEALLSSLALLPSAEVLHLFLAGSRSRMFFGAHPLASTLSWSWSLRLGLHASRRKQGSKFATR